MADAIKKFFAWSYSVLDMYRTCPKKYYHIKVAKDAKDDDSSFSASGKITHKAIFDFLINDKPLPITERHYETLITPFKMMPGEKHGELQLALNRKLEPCAWFDGNTWVRAIVDFMLINGDKALIVDWKTGKVRDGFEQIKMAAAIVSRMMPEIETFTVAFVWVNQNEITKRTLQKKHLRAVWADLLPQVQEIAEALQTTSFPATPTPLCKWCPVRQCPENKKP